MGDREHLSPTDEVPEADAVEQHRSADFEAEGGLDTTYLTDDAKDRDANEADLIDQAYVIPLSDNDREPD